jgi:hypothetical protein
MKSTMIDILEKRSYSLMFKNTVTLPNSTIHLLWSYSRLSKISYSLDVFR